MLHKKTYKYLFGILTIIGILLLITFVFLRSAYPKQNRNVDNYITGNYQNYNKGEVASKFFPNYQELNNYENIKFLYKDLGKRISLHKYYTFFMLDITYKNDEYQAEKNRLSKYIEVGDSEYDMLDDYLINRVVIDDPLYQNNFACICFNDASNTIRYIIFCGLKVNDKSKAMIQSVISWHVGKEWNTD